MVADAAEACGLKRPVIETEEADIALWAGMDSGRFTAKTGWRPETGLRKTLEDMIRG